MIGDIVRKDMITDISHFQVIMVHPIERINNNITVGVQIAAHNDKVTEVNNINLEIKTVHDKMTNKATLIKAITGVDPLAEACNLLGGLLVTTKVDIEREKARKKAITYPGYTEQAVRNSGCKTCSNDMPCTPGQCWAASMTCYRCRNRGHLASRCNTKLDSQRT